MTAAAWIVALVIFFPILWTILTSFKSEGDAINLSHFFSTPWTIDSYFEVQSRSDYFHHFFNSVIISIGSTVLALLFSIPAAWSMAFAPTSRTRDLMMWMLSTKMMPAVGVLVPIYLIFKTLGLLDNVWGIMSILMLMNLPIVVWMLYTYFKEIPVDILEAARMDGAGEFRIFFTIALRLLAPGVVTVLLFAVVATWNNYFLPLIMLSDPNLYPLTVGLNQWSAQAQGVSAHPIYNLVVTGSLLTIIPIVVAFLFLQRSGQSGLAAGSVKA